MGTLSAPRNSSALAPMRGAAATLPSEELSWPARIRAGDVTAFDAMFRAYACALCDFASQYVRSRAVAEELVQDVFLRIWRARRTRTVHGSLRTYLFVAVRHAALNHLRHERIERRWEERVVREYAHVAPRSSRSPSEDQLFTSELTAAVDLAIQQLPERCRLVYTLTRRQHLSYAEVAEVLSISVKTVENQVGIALKSLRKQLAHLL